MGAGDDPRSRRPAPRVPGAGDDSVPRPVHGDRGPLRVADLLHRGSLRQRPLLRPGAARRRPRTEARQAEQSASGVRPVGPRPAPPRASSSRQGGPASPRRAAVARGPAGVGTARPRRDGRHRARPAARADRAARRRCARRPPGACPRPPRAQHGHALPAEPDPRRDPRAPAVGVPLMGHRRRRGVPAPRRLVARVDDFGRAAGNHRPGPRRRRGGAAHPRRRPRRQRRGPRRVGRLPGRPRLASRHPVLATRRHPHRAAHGPPPGDRRCGEVRRSPAASQCRRRARPCPAG